MHERVCRQRVVALGRQFPAVSILGPRQAGKSTLAKLSFPDAVMYDLEDPNDLRLVSSDPLLALGRHRRVIFDEAQRLPSLFPVLRSFLDRNPDRRVVLLGSASPSLVQGISESLTGRVGFFELGGVSVLEAPAQALWLKGSFPRVHWSKPRSPPATWYPSYLKTTLEQDLPMLGFRLPSARLHNFVSMLAHAQGGLSDLSAWGGSLGIDHKTVAHMLDVLEGVFLVRRLRPYFANLKKRLVKSPKVYLRDTGLLHSLLGTGFTEASLFRHPKAGASFETFVIEQLVTAARYADPSSQAFFFRSQDGIEVDLLLSLRGKLIPIEVKLGLQVPAVRPLQTTMDLLGLKKGFVVSHAAQPMEVARGIAALSLTDLLDELSLGR